MDPYEFLNISQNPDGSLNRPILPISPPTDGEESATDSSVLSKDVPLNQAHNTWLRLFLPKSHPAGKLPIILYVHGGGFILLSAASSIFHDSCFLRAANIPALIVSLDYRLAPEHRLPAAYDDAVDALLWLRDQAQSIDTGTSDPWLRDHADFSRCFIMGTSAGGNIAYNLALRSLDLHVEPLRIAGLILSQPYFGGVERTESEARSVDNRTLPLAVIDVMWELSLPTGADRDHEYCNPLPTIAKAKGLPRCLVKGFVGDPLLDRMREFAKALEREGVSVATLMEDEGFHGIEFFSPEKAAAMVAEFKSFIYY